MKTMIRMSASSCDLLGWVLDLPRKRRAPTALRDRPGGGPRRGPRSSTVPRARHADTRYGRLSTRSRWTLP